MLNKIYDYKGVIIFYILLALILMIISNHNRNIDIKLNNSGINCVIEWFYPFFMI